MLRRAGTKNSMTWSSVIPLHSLTPFIPPKRSLNRVITLKFHGILMNRCVLPTFFRLSGDNWIVNCFLFTFLMDKTLMTIYRQRWRHLRKCTNHMMYFHTKRERGWLNFGIRLCVVYTRQCGFVGVCVQATWTCWHHTTVFNFSPALVFETRALGTWNSLIC